MTRRSAAEVIADHAPRLTGLPGVVGVAEGALDDGTPCIVVLVEARTEELARHVPKTLEGHPVELRETGALEAR